MIDDKAAAHELALYTTNDRQLFQQQAIPIISNLNRKIAKGIYNETLALKLWGYLAQSGAQKYAKEFGGTWHQLFSVPTRKEAAKEIAKHYADHLALELVMKKNPSPRARINKFTRRRLEKRFKATGSAPSRERIEREFREARNNAGIERLEAMRKNPRKKKRTTFSAKQLAAQKRFAQMARRKWTAPGQFKKRLRAVGPQVRKIVKRAFKRANLPAVARAAYRNPRGFDVAYSPLILTATIRGIKYYFTGREWDTMRNRALRIRGLNKAKKKAALLASKSGNPVNIES